MDLGCNTIVPGKRVKYYTVIKKINKIARPTWLPHKYELHDTIIMLRIEYRCSDKKYVLYTSNLNGTIEKSEIIQKYFTRWYIEIPIREINNE